MTCGWAGSIIRGLCDSVLCVSKDIRQAVEPLLDAVEIEDVALRYLDETNTLAGKTVLVIGTGVLGKGLVAGLLERHCPCIWVYHRNIPQVDERHARQVEVVQLGELPRVLTRADVVISAVNVQEPVLTSALHGGSFNPSGVVMVDLGMPHNIETALHAPDAQRRLVGLDTLKHWARAANAAQGQVSEACANVVISHRDSYERIRKGMQGESV